MAINLNKMSNRRIVAKCANHFQPDVLNAFLMETARYSFHLPKIATGDKKM